MFTQHSIPLRRIAGALVIAGAATACESGTGPASGTLAAPDVPSAARSEVTFPATPTVFATGLQFPRGLKFGPDGALYVAEAGTAGPNFTTGSQCPQVVPPVGPYHNGATARISRITASGARTTFASGFPSGVNALGDVLGVADVAFVEHKMYALSSGGGCSHGTLASPAGIARVSSTGSWSIMADLSAWQATHHVAHPEADDFEPDGSWYGMIATEHALVAVEPNHGEVVSADARTGVVSRIVDVSASQGHIVPTVVAERKGALYISNLGTFPSAAGAETIFRISRTGGISVVATGFSKVLGLVFDHSGRLYVLESSTADGYPAPFTGDVVRLDKHGRRTVIVKNLFLPTGITIGPDGRLYISNHGFGPPGMGEILRVDLRDDGRDDDDMERGDG
ncbi:MAG: ScyD/ScyE family protein [Tepidiformaceae bacterium]